MEKSKSVTVKEIVDKNSCNKASLVQLENLEYKEVIALKDQLDKFLSPHS